MNSLLARIIPFFVLGIMVVLLIVGIILFSYLLVLGAIVGFVLFLAAWLKNKLFRSKQTVIREQTPEKQGRIIDHDEKH